MTRDFEQVGPLHYGVVLPNEVFERRVRAYSTAIAWRETAVLPSPRTEADLRTALPNRRIP